MRKITKKLFAITLTVFLIAQTLVGCGTTEESDSTSVDVSDEEVTITVLCGYASEDPHGQYVYEYAENFMAENENITVEITAISSNDIYTKLAAMATTPDDIPTLFFATADSIATLYDLGITEDISEYASDELLASFANGVVESVELEGEMTYYPIAVQPTAVLYRIDRFEEAGIEIPTTWDEFVEACEQLTVDTDGDGVVDQWGFSMVGSNNSSGSSRFLSYIWSNGYDVIYEEDGVWKTDITTDAAFIDVFSTWTDMNEDGVVPVGITEVDYATAANYFAMGYTSMFMTGANALGVAYESNPDLEGLIGSFTIPSDYPGTMLNTEGYAMSSYATDAEKAAAVAFLEYFSTADDDMTFWSASGKIPATTEGQSVEWLSGEDYAGFLQQIEDGCLPTVTFAGISSLKTALGNAYSAVFSAEKDVETAVEDLVDDIDELLGDYN